MAASSIRIPRVSSSCLLSLWETPQDQQNVLTLAPFKLLLLLCVPESVRFCVHPLSVESLFATSFWVSLKQASLTFKTKCSEGLSW